MAFDFRDIKVKIVIAVIWFFVGAGVMFLALAKRLIGDGTPVKESFKGVHKTIKGRLK